MPSSNKISVAMLIDAWFPFYGGGQVHVRNLSQALQKNYPCRVKIFAPRSHSVIARFIWSVTVLFDLLSQNHKKNFQLIHSHAYIAGLPAKIASQLLNIPVVHTVHGSSQLDQKKFGPKTQLEKFLLTEINYDAQITVSSNFLTHSNINKNITVIPNAVDIKKFDPINVKKYHQPTLIWVGRNDSVKGFKYLEKAITGVKKSIPNLKTVLVTDGHLTGKNLIKAYKKSHIFVLSSLAEGQPITLLEAWAAKLPVVVTRVGNNPKFVKNNFNGLLVPPKNSKALSEAIVNILSNPQKARAMGQAGYKLVKKDFTWEKVAHQTYQVYKKLLE